MEHMYPYVQIQKGKMQVYSNLKNTKPRLK